ncbi:lysophospholipid acyltransferase family protein [Anaeroselena agilis]|uniref:Lysophospholipid acyltransferase family protein n=1 Tax=Anaeroselena agilis TaxID=3063788 RepID=A0ABU3P557_9FIRM|nr:lysophospholipid acyltransferase family protein [Selenomonadales bacterium 4137-cl]
MQYYLVKLICWLLRPLPAGMRNRIGDFIGESLWPLVPMKRREMAVANVMASLGLDAPSALAVVRRSAVRFGRMFMELLTIPKLTRNNIDSFVILRGREYFDQAFAHGKGVIIAAAHSGNWELIGPALALYGYEIVGVAQRQTNAAMDRLINEIRTSTGMHITYKSGVREMIAYLSEGKAIGLIMDQDAREQGVFTEFFGRIASTPQGPAALSRMKGSLIVPTFITANADGTHTIIFHPPLATEKTDDRDRDFLVTTRKLNAILEEHIRAHPHEWFWLHNRWKTKPPAEKAGQDK